MEFGKLNYLIIDDFENFRLSMRQMLRSCGADRIEQAGTAAQAIRHCTYNHVDVVLCDYNLGEGRNGQHVLEELRHRKLLKRASLFLMVTAETSKQMVMGARENQPDGYLTKPINRAMLDQRLGALIEQRNALYPINRELDRENYPEAISLCRQALPKHPRYRTWLLKTLGDLYFQLGDLSHAARVFDDALKQRELSWARLGRSKVMLANRNYEDAVASLSQLIARHPDYMEAYDLLAEGLQRQGKLVDAQHTLEQAAMHSPNALLRQRHLAQLAEANQDLEAACEAWRKTVTLGTHSIHDSADHYLALAQSLTDLSEGDAEDAGAERADEALNLLKQMGKRFPEQPELDLRSRLIQCRVLAGRGKVTDANRLLDQIREEIGGGQSLTADTALDYGKTLFRLGHTGEAKTLQAELAERFASDNEVLNRIEALLDEPVGFRQKLQARTLNRDGIKAFESGDLSAAVEAFSQALEIVPDHAALNLNLVQVLMKQRHSEADSSALLDRCRRCLDRLAGLPEQHRQHRRYLALRRKLEELTP